MNEGMVLNHTCLCLSWLWHWSCYWLRYAEELTHSPVHIHTLHHLCMWNNSSMKLSALCPSSLIWIKCKRLSTMCSGLMTQTDWTLDTNAYFFDVKQNNRSCCGCKRVGWLDTSEVTGDICWCRFGHEDFRNLFLAKTVKMSLDEWFQLVNVSVVLKWNLEAARRLLILTAMR